MHEPGRGNIRFGTWELRPIERVLLVQGKPAKIGNRALDVLLVLATGAGEPVSKEDLLATVWRGLVVEDNNLTVQVTALRRLLGADAIVTVPGRGYRLAERPQAPPPPAAAPRSPPPPAAPVLVGRDRELGALVDLLVQCSVVSVVGTGGVGKTALARAAAARLAGTWRDGIHWLELAPLPRSAPLLPVLAKALQVSLDQLGQEPPGFPGTLSDLEALVVLDNCEHVVGRVAELLQQGGAAAPGIRWLITSQEPLRVAGEVVLRLGALDLPAAGADLHAAAGSGALRLFRERTRAMDRSFELDAGNVEMAVEICRQLDGLPLALEMAAARVASLGLEGVRDQLGERLRLLTGQRGAPERQMTLGGTFDWSYGLLSPVEQQLFRRLEPFKGGFDAAMAQAMGRLRPDDLAPIDDRSVLAALGALIDKSLVQRAPGSGRLYLLEGARAYARDRLDALGEQAAVAARHAQVVAERFERCDDELKSLSDAAWIARYAAERHNVRAALLWAVDARDADLLALMVASLASLDYQMETQAEVLHVDFPADLLAAAAPRLRARAHLHYAWAQYAYGNRERATELMQRALADFESEGDPGGMFRALTLLVRICRARPGMAAEAQAYAARLLAMKVDETQVPLRLRLMCAIVVQLEDGSPRIARLTEVQMVARSAGLDTVAAMCCAYLTDALLMQGRFEEAAAAAEASMQTIDSHPRSKALVCHNHALALVRLGRCREAQAPARAALRALPSAAPLVIDVCALAAATEQRWPVAALLAGYGEQVRRHRARGSDPAEASAITDTRALLQEALSPERLAELLQLGAALTPEAALAIALPALPAGAST